MKWDGASRWLQKNVDVEFWKMAETLWNDQNLQYREELNIVNAKLGFKARKNGMKHFSYGGPSKLRHGR